MSTRGRTSREQVTGDLDTTNWWQMWDPVRYYCLRRIELDDNQTI